MLASATAGLVQHAAGDFQAASDSFDAVAALADPQQHQQHQGHGQQEQGGAVRPSAGGRDDLIAPALKQAAAFRLALGDEDAAEHLATRAAAGAEAAATAAAGGGVAGVGGGAAPGASPVVLGEALADARMLGAQVAMHGKLWELAEERLGEVRGRGREGAAYGLAANGVRASALQAGVAGRGWGLPPRPAPTLRARLHPRGHAAPCA